jgi:hypothetical protein
MTAIADQQNAHLNHEQITASLLAAGSTVELAGGAAAIVLSVIGLGQAWPLLMAAIATIAAGAALLAHGAAATARWSDLVGSLDGADRGLVGGGLGLEVVGGASAIVLGVLALAGVMPEGMVAVAALVLGGSLVVAGAVPPQLAFVTSDRDVELQQRMRTGLVFAAGTLVLCGIAAGLLGILGIIDVGSPVTLALAAMLVVGVALLVAGSASAFKFARALTA